jgi:phytol kinase
VNPWWGIVLVLGSLTLLLAGCRYGGQRFSLSAELTRKMVHMGMGLICTLFPLVFRTTWPVFLLAGTAVAALLVVRSSTVLRTTIGSSLHGVERSSLGEIFFPVAVAAVWYFSLEKPLYFSLSVLVLTLADAFAALVGTKYGQQQYTTMEGYKTWEGSFIFFAATFLCIHIPLLLLTTTGRAESLLIALLIGILVMIVEAVAWRGLDNLFIPLCVCILLNVYDSFSASQILVRIAFILLIIVILFFLRPRTKLDDASILGASLVTYLAVTAGNWQWAVAPVLVFVNYLLLGKAKDAVAERIHNIHALLAVTLPGLLWLLLYYRQQQQIFFFSYNLAYMAELVCIFIAQWAFEFKERSLVRITLKSSLLSFVMIMGPCFVFIYREVGSAGIALAFVCAMISGQLFRLMQPQIRDCPLDSQRFFRQGFIGFGISVVPWVAMVFFN